MPVRRNDRLVNWVGGAICAVAMASAHAQSLSPINPPPQVKPGGSPVIGGPGVPGTSLKNAAGIRVAKVKVAEPGPYVKQEKAQYFNFRVYVRVGTERNELTDSGGWNRRRVNFGYETLTAVFPIVHRTASSEADITKAVGTMSINERDVVKGNFLIDAPPGRDPRGMILPEILKTQLDGDPYHSGTWLAKFAVGDAGQSNRANSMWLQIDVPTTAYNTVFDETNASKVPWPKEGWPIVAATTFLPQLFVDAIPGPSGMAAVTDMKDVDALIKKWCKGNDPLSLTPVALAKFLCQQLINEYRLDSNSLNYKRGSTGGGVVLEGLRINGAAAAAANMRGTEWDMVCLLTALYRRAGLPARIVVGYDKDTESRRKEVIDDVSGGGSSRGSARAWVEFYLYDEARNTGNWVPVDPVRIRSSQTKAPNLNQKWKFFGTHDELRGVMPFAMHFHPPTSVLSYGSPGFWGWHVTPGSPAYANQSVVLTGFGSTVPSREDRDRRQREREKEDMP